MSDPLLKVRNLHGYFPTAAGAAKVLNGIDISVDKGNTVALVGESGCGKSVTMKSIMGLLSPPEIQIPEGEIRFRDKNLLEASNKERRALRGSDIGMILQDPMTSLNPVFTIGEQMIDVLKWQHKDQVSILDYVYDKFRNHDDLKENALDMLERVQISSPERVFSSYPHELSGGMRQRVLIAITFLSEPDLLIADEPGTALDVTTESKILDLFNEVIEETNTSVLYVTHDLGVARKVSDYTYVMYAGEIVENAPTKTLFDDPQHPYSRGLLESIPKLAGGIGDGIDGQLPDYTDPPSACRFVDRCPFAAEECREVYPYQREVDPNHGVACHLFDGVPTYERDTAKDYPPVEIGTAPWDDTQGTNPTPKSEQ